MLELLTGFGERTVAVRASGEITREEYKTILIPKVKTIMEKHDKVSCFMHLTEGTTYSMGALATDTVFGLGHMFTWDRIALVTDVQWVHKAAGLILPLMPFKVKLFVEAEYDDAKKWLEE